MAYGVSANQLIRSARQRANLEGATAFLPDSEVLEYINASIAAWYDMVRLTTFGGQFYRKTATINLVNGQAKYGVADGFPADFASLISVDGFVAPGSGPVVISIAPYQEEDRNMYRWWPTVAAVQSPVYCQLQGDGIAFLPIPFSGSSVGINYVPTAPFLISTDDILETWNGWHEWIVLDVAIKMLVKDGQTDILPMLSAMKAEQQARIEKAAAARNTGQPELVHDVEGYGGRGRGWPWGY